MGSKTLGLCLLLALFSVIQGQDQTSIVPLRPGRTEYVLPCALRVFSYGATGSYMAVTFTAKSDVPFDVYLSPWVPGQEQSKGSILLDVCLERKRSCNTTKSGETCTITEACGVLTGTWYISVKTSDFIDGFFSLFVDTRTLAVGPKLPMYPSLEGALWKNVDGSAKPLDASPISKYDFFYFEKPIAITGRESVLHIDLVPTSPKGSTLRSWINYGNVPAFPDTNCQAFPENTLLVPACEFRQAKDWQFTVERTVENQQYKIRAYAERMSAFSFGFLILAEYKSETIAVGEKVLYTLDAQDDHLFLEFDNIELTEEDLETNRMFVVVDNVVGGRVEMAVNYGSNPWIECSNSGSKQCATSMGCSVLFNGCDLSVQNDTKWKIGIRALSVESHEERVSFTVSIRTYLIQIGESKNPNQRLAGQLRPGQLAAYRMKIPDLRAGYWIDFDLYVDRGDTQLPASLLLSTTPFPEDGCNSYHKKCVTSATSKGTRDIKSCTLQLDPCEMALFTDGIYISVIATPDPAVHESLWYQDKMGFTLSAELWNPQLSPNVLTVGQIITDAVADRQYNVYHIADFQGVLEVSVSGTQHPPVAEKPTTTNDCTVHSDDPEKCLLQPDCGYCIRTKACLPCSNLRDHCFEILEGSCNVGEGDDGEVYDDEKRAIDVSNFKYYNQPEIAVSVLYGYGTIGPSCECWNLEETYVVNSTETQTFIIPSCIPRGGGVYIAVTGISTTIDGSDNFKYSENEYVLSTRLLEKPLPSDELSLAPGVLSSARGTEPSVYGRTEHWILDFPRENLATKALVLRLRAHPRSGRRMDFAHYDGDFDFTCGNELPVDESCTVSEENKGFCVLTFQACFFQGDRDGRNFVVVISTENFGASDVDKTYDFSYEILDQEADTLELGAPATGTLTQGIYKHFDLVVPFGSETRKTLIIEAYFDPGVQVTSSRDIVLYGNSPKHADKLAGSPSHGCYCNSFFTRDTEKVVHIVDRCAIMSGTYRLSVYTDALHYDELPARFTIHAYTVPYLIELDLGIEKPFDQRLYAGQTQVYTLSIPERMLDSLNTTDKELTITTNTDLHKYNANVQFSLHTLLTDCACTRYGDEGEVCSLSDGNQGECNLQRDHCQLRPPGHWFLETWVEESEDHDYRQPVPFTISVSKVNSNKEVQVLPISESCGEGQRTEIRNYLGSQELLFYRLENVRNSSLGYVQIYVSELTDGDVDVFVGHNFLPTTFCNEGSKHCEEAPNGPNCIFVASCAESVSHVSVRARSTNENAPVTFRISACFAPKSTIEFNSGTSKSTKLALGASETFEFNMRNKVNHDKTPAIVAKVTSEGFQTGDQYSIVMTRGACGQCEAFGATANCTTRDCSLVVFYCDLPADFENANWTLAVNNDKARAGSISFATRIFSVDVPDARTAVIVDDQRERAVSIPSLAWSIAQWTLTKARILSLDKGAQRSLIKIQSNDRTATNIVVWTDTHEQGGCPKPLADGLAQNKAVFYDIGACCTYEGTYLVYFFNRFPSQIVTVNVAPSLPVESEHREVVWGAAIQSAKTTWDLPAQITADLPTLREVFTKYPGANIPYSSQVVRILHKTRSATLADDSKLKAFIQQDGLAGNRPDCYTALQEPNFYETEAVWSRMACPSLPPHTLWVGLENSNPTIETVDVEVRTVSPIPLTMGTASATVSSWYGVNQQFTFTMPEKQWPMKDVHITVEMFNGTAVVFYNKDTAAGLYKEGGCTDAFSEDKSGQRVIGSGKTDTGAIWERIIPSCKVNSGSWFIGVQPTTYGVSTFRVKWWIADTPGTVTPVALGLGVANRKTLTGAKNLIVPVPAGSAMSTTYLRVMWNQFSGISVPLSTVANGSIYRDGFCQPFDTFFCSNDFGVQTCSAIVPACHLRENTSYNIIFSTGVYNPTYNVTAELLTLNPLVLALPSVLSSSNLAKELFPQTINSHDLRLFRFNVPTTNLMPGEKISVFLEKIFCGQVLLSGNLGDPAGPYCTADPPCTESGCEVASLSQCNLFVSDYLRTDFWLLARGGQQTQNSPMQFTLGIQRTGGKTMKTFRYLEKHTIRSVAIPVADTIVCPKTKPPTLTEACCDNSIDAPNTTYTFSAEPVVFSFPIEGAQLLGTGHRLTLELDDVFVASARLRVHNVVPSFCTSAPHFTLSPGLYDECVASDDTDRKCIISLNKKFCTLADSQQLFITVDQVEFSASVPNTDATPFEVATVKHSVRPHEVIEVYRASEPQWLRFQLAKGEVTYFKIFHHEPNDPGNVYNDFDYHFNAQVTDVRGGTVKLWEDWSCGTKHVCGDSQCHLEEGAISPCSNKQLACSCKFDQNLCDTDTNVNNEGFFRLQVVDLVEPFELVEGRIRFHSRIKVASFPAVDKSFSKPNCTTVQCGLSKYFDPTPSRSLNPDELYHFRLVSLSGAVEMHVNTGSVPVIGLNNPDDAQCTRAQSCIAKGAGNECDLIFRMSGEKGLQKPYVVVAPWTGEPCSDGSHKRFTFIPSIFKPTIFTLRNADTHDSYFYDVTDPSSACIERTHSEFYKFVVTDVSNYLVVELETHPGSGRKQVWINQNHITYRYGDGCTTDPRTGKCRFVLLCGYETATYYMQVGNVGPTEAFGGDGAWHKITVTALKANVIPPIDTSTSVTMSADFNELVVVKSSALGTADGNPLSPLQFFWSTGALVDTWTTVNDLGDSRCSNDAIYGARQGVFTVEACRLHQRSSSGFDAINLHFIRVPTQSCVTSQVTVRKTFVPSSVPIVPNAKFPTLNANTILSGTKGQTMLLKYSGFSLGDNQVIYTRLFNVRDGSISHTVHKGNYLRGKQPCDADCTGVSPYHALVSWFDLCWHCGNNVYDTIFVKVNIDDVKPQVSRVSFQSEVVVTTWERLTSNWRAMRWEGNFRDIAFFTATLSPDNSHRLELDVINGTGVEVSVYPADCDRRTQPVQMWCFPGARCELPFPHKHNFGSFWRQTKLDSTFTDDVLRITVSGLNTSFKIRHLTGRNETCESLTETSAPFCFEHRIPSNIGTEEQHTGQAFGDSATFPQKDARAEDLYDQLIEAFACPPDNKCGCGPLTVECKAHIAEFACYHTFGFCHSRSGFEQQIPYAMCNRIQSSCGKTFEQAGLPYFSCHHNYYQNGTRWVDENDRPIFPLDDDLPPENEDLSAGWIALIILCSIIFIAILLAIAFVLFKRNKRGAIGFGSGNKDFGYERLGKDENLW